MTEPLRDFIFLTGLYRSGTTLLDKLMHAHPAICLGSQPMAALIIYVKQLFLQKLNCDQEYPLSHGFLEPGYQPAALADFLRELEISESDLAEIFELQERLDSPYCLPNVLGDAKMFSPGPYWQQWKTLQKVVRRELNRTDANFCGLKEINSEEFLPYFLAAGATGVIIIRDPRDVVVSSLAPGAKQFIGDSRPTLYTLRCWRKSVQMAMKLADSQRFHLVKFEDLVQATANTANGLFAKLGLPEVDFESQTVYDQLGKPWRPNSSTEDVAGKQIAAVGRFQTDLKIEDLNYVEAICGAEMQWLGYDVAGSAESPERCVADFLEPVTISHRAFATDYSSDECNVANELKRLSYLQERQALSDAEAAQWFGSQSIYQQLIRALK